MEVILVRHTSVGVPEGTCYGQSDVPVAATFEVEAAATKKELEKFGKIEKAYSSPLTRARMLARFCGYGDAEVDERLLEMSMGDWEMLKYEEIEGEYIRRWYDDFLHLPTPNGESFVEQTERVGRFLDELREKSYERVVIFAHGGVLGCAGIYGGLYTLEDAWDNLTPYGGIIRINI